MNAKDEKYTSYMLCKEMMETADVVRRFDPATSEPVAREVEKTGRLFIAGEGSSRIFPAKNSIRKALTWGLDVRAATDGGYQAATYDLSGFTVVAISNSGRTKEVVRLVNRLADAGHQSVFGLTTREENLFAGKATKVFVLNCGFEKAVAATKSVVAQALFVQSIISHVAGRNMKKDLAGLPEKLTEALTAPIDADLISSAANASTLYFAGYNDGVAEELTLKTNEIPRKNSDYLEGTYAVHGIEEAMSSTGVVMVVEPIMEEIPTFKKQLADGVGMTVAAIATQKTELPTLVLPDAGEMNPYLFLAAGWNFLVEVGLAQGINIDKPQRARKIGNEFKAG